MSTTTTIKLPYSKGSVPPPLFGEFGKKAKDLFKKKYDFENSATLINRPADGGKIETKVVASESAPLRGVLKSELPVVRLGRLNGVFESEFHTVPDRESKTTYKITKLYPGLNVTLGLVGIKPAIKGDTPEFPEGWASVEAVYKQEFVSGSVAVRTNSQKTLVDGVVSLAYNNLLVGGKVTVDTASKQAPTDYNFGAEIVGRDYVATALTEKKRSALKLAFYQEVTKTQKVGAEATFGLLKPQRSLTFGSDYQMDIDTSARGFVRVDSGKDAATIGLALEHRLLNPSVLIGVATEYNVTPTALSAGKFGVSLTFGDF